MGREGLRSREDRRLSFLVDFPDEIPRRVGHVSVSFEIHRYAVRDVTRRGGGDDGLVGGEEGREEETAAFAEVVSGEGVKFRERFRGVDDGEETVVDGVDGEA